MRTPHLRNVRITRLCAGAERAVTSAVRMGEFSAGNAACSRCSAVRKPRNGPTDSGSAACSVSLRWNASRPFLARHPLAFVAEQHRVAIEGDTQLLTGARRRRAGQDGGGSHTGRQRAADILGVGREEQVGLERRDVVRRRRAAGKRRAADVQAVMLDRIEDAQAGVAGVARQQDDFHRRHVARELVQPEQLLHQRERHAGLEDLVLVLDLEAAVGIEAVALEQIVAVAQVEQGARGNRHHQAVVAGSGRIMGVGRRRVMGSSVGRQPMDERGDASIYSCRPGSIHGRELLVEDALLEVVLRIEQQAHALSPDWRMVTVRTSRTSWKSAVALTGRLPGSSTRRITSVRCGRIAPRQRRGRNGLIGVSASTLASSGRIGPCAERL